MEHIVENGARWKYGFSLVLKERPPLFTSDNREGMATLVFALRPGLLTQLSGAILADETASETVECPELRAGISCLSFLPLHLPSPFLRSSTLSSFPDPFNSAAAVLLARLSPLSISHSGSLFLVLDGRFFSPPPPSPFCLGSLSFW